MKKLIYGTLFLALVGIGVVGCKKDTIKNSNRDSIQGFTLKNSNINGNVGTDGVMLIFNDTIIYDEVVSDTNQQNMRDFMSTVSALSYKSYNEHVEQSNTTDLIENEFLGSILNQDRIVQIGDYLFKIDLQNEKVFVLASQHINQYSDLVNSNLNNSNIREFSTEENVIQLAYTGLVGDHARARFFCTDSRAPGRNQNGEAGIQLGNGAAINFNYKTRYFAAGIFFNLLSTANSFVHGISINNFATDYPEYYTYGEGISLYIEARRRYKERCHGDVGYHTFGAIKTLESASDVVKLQSYQGSRGLNRYELLTNLKFWYNNNWLDIKLIPSTFPNNTTHLFPSSPMYGYYHIGVKYGY